MKGNPKTKRTTSKPMKIIIIIIIIIIINFQRPFSMHPRENLIVNLVHQSGPTNWTWV